MKVWDFMTEFVTALTEQLKNDDMYWEFIQLKQRIPEGHEWRIEEHIKTYFDQYRNGGVPMPWLKVAGLAMIAWIRDNHPEFWNKE